MGTIISKKEKKARRSLINSFLKGLTMQCVAVMNQTHLLYGHSAAFYKAEGLHLLTSRLFKAACFHGSKLDIDFSAAYVIWRATSATAL